MPTRKRKNSEAPKRDPEARPKLGALRRYEITGMFGQRNFSFDLDPREPTLLTGINGSGKSTILRSIDAISTGRWNALCAIPFADVRLTFDSGIQFHARQTADELALFMSGEDTWKVPKSIFALMPDLSSGLPAAELLARLRRQDITQYRRVLNALEKRSHSSQGLLPGFGDAADRYLIHGFAATPEWIDEVPHRFPVFFITDQRLLIEAKSESGSRSESVSTAAEAAAKNIAAEIAAAQAEYANRSQSLDRDFPRRVLTAMRTGKPIPEAQLRDQLEQLSGQREALQRSGLLPSEDNDDLELLDIAGPHAQAVISTYVENTRNKLLVLEPLRRRLSLFTEFLNQHYRGTKKIFVDQREGFVIRVADQEEQLSPSRLSSGEQQILVLAHHILFRAEGSTLVLIDEPELSLHVVWQSTLVEDLAEMGRERNLSFLLATHSPTLIAGRDDLKRSLDK